MVDNSFFNQPTDQSLVKIAIVSKYFEAWANVMIGHRKRQKDSTDTRIAYIDLFAGKGTYDDGSESTPIIILKKAIEKEDLRNSLITIFNEKDTDNYEALCKNIDQLPGINTLKYKPQKSNHAIGNEIAALFKRTRLVPTLFFVDPWGYKGLTIELLGALIKDWGCDCIFFFNYNRINMSIDNKFFIESINDLFGSERANKLRIKLDPLNAQQRELTILEEIAQALKDIGGKYVLPFCFKKLHKAQTSHHLILVTKGFKGYEIMKDIMAKESENPVTGIPSFEYVPGATVYQPNLFDLLMPLAELEESLLNDFAGYRIQMKDIYEKHSIGKRFISRHYKDALRQLLAKNQISVNRPENKPIRSGTFPDDIIVTFPKKEN